MALTDCTLPSLKEKQGCYSCLSPSQKLSIKVWLMAKAYEMLYGVAPLTVNEAAELLACGACEPDDVLETMETTIWQSYASSLGATSDGVDVWDMTTPQLVEATKCYPCANPKLIRAAEIALLCQILTYSRV